MTGNCFTSSINMSKKVKDNIKYLNLHAKYFKPDVKPMVNELVKLYSDRKISNMSTVTNIMNTLASTEKKQRAKGVIMYEKVKAKYETMTTLGERLQQKKTEREKNKKDVAENKAAARIQIYQKYINKRKKDVAEKKVTYYNVDVIFYRLASKDNRDRKKDKDHKSIHFGKYVKFTNLDLNVTVKGKFPLPVNELIHFETAEAKVEFQQGLNIFVSDSDFEKWYSALTYPFDAYYITTMKATDDTKGKKYNPLDEGLKDASKIAMNSKYMHTTLDLDCCTFANAMKNKMYVETECWINSITDFYGGTGNGRYVFKLYTRHIRAGYMPGYSSVLPA